jgi:D-glycero-D-manno-heptose 1,7-bisphosphate phosphatase
VAEAAKVPRPAVFLDRDGTINVDRGYVHRLEELELIPGAARAIAQLNAHGFLTLVVTNQSGVARGMFSEDDVTRLHAELERRLSACDARIDAFYVAYAHPTEGQGDYRLDSPLRKPGIGMYEQARGDFALATEESWMIGDKLADMEFARAAGLRGILVRTGKGCEELARCQDPHWFSVADDLAAAVAMIMAERGLR